MFASKYVKSLSRLIPTQRPLNSLILTSVFNQRSTPYHSISITNTINRSVHHKTHGIKHDKELQQLIDKHGKNSLEVANYLETRSEELGKEGLYDSALKMAKEAQIIYRENKMSAGEFILFNKISDLYLKMNNYNGAIEAIKEHIRLKESINGKNHQSTQHLHYKLASLYLHEGKFNEAFEDYQEVLDFMGDKNLGEADKSAYLHYFLGLCSYNLEKYDEAKDHVLKALESFEAKQDNKAIYRCGHLLGLVYEGKEDSSASLIYFKRALLGAEEVYEADSYEIGLINYLIGKAEYRLDRVEPAIKYTEKALAVFNKDQKRYAPDIADAQYNLALMYYKNKSYDEALKHINEALGHYKRISKGDNLKILLALENKAMMLQSLGRTAEAIETFKQAILICDSYKNTKSIQIAKIYYNVATVYSQFYEDKIEEANKYAQKALEIASHYKDLPFYKDAQALASLVMSKA